ncbi:MAG: hypothetical protein ACLRFF_04435 [Alphaproteobacteria bacterium]
MSLLQKLKARRAKRLEQRLVRLFENVKLPEINPEITGQNTVIAWDKVTKLSEELNDAAWNFPVYADTTKLLPGYIVYIIGERPPTAEKPYVTYKPEPRVVSSIHDSGVNGGTTFFTFSHRIVKPQSITKGEKDFQVISEEDVIYSPLTKAHAEYICKLLNLQSKRLYEKNLLKITNQQNKK